MYSSGADLAMVGLLATKGILMAPLAPPIVGSLLLGILIYLLVVDSLKIAIFARFGAV